MLQRLKITSYALIILLILVLPSQADEYCTTEDMCAAAAQAAGKMLGNKGKNGISGYPFVLGTNTYGCWYYPDSHANKNYAGSAFWGAASSEAQMRDPDPGAAHHVRLKCGVANAAPTTSSRARSTNNSGGAAAEARIAQLEKDLAASRSKEQAMANAARELTASKARTAQLESERQRRKQRVTELERQLAKAEGDLAAVAVQIDTKGAAPSSGPLSGPLSWTLRECPMADPSEEQACRAAIRRGVVAIIIHTGEKNYRCSFSSPQGVDGTRMCIPE